MAVAKDVVTAYIDRVWNRCDLRALDELTTADFTYQLAEQPPRGREAMGEFLKATHAAFPDWQVEIVQVVAEDDSVAVRWRGRVTHRGAFHGIPATGRKIAVSGINMYVVEEGRVKREWEQTDSLGILHQIGALPTPRGGP